MINAIQWYRTTISARTLPTCKYYPTCSTYALTAIERFGAVRGGTLALLRLMRCRPWSRGGIDDVPHKFSVFYRFSWSSAHEEPSIEPQYHPYE
ncbi:membrane protein insertion efficiency factor YidD [Alloscardovia criceti]|uniref:membrane protein insertion efficiency factor YidD n=1 Tax=Alloscardovia criceti TaxID=356828 RepID=UPI001B7FB045|nr:membrane protein insertion efficiency factor YidD [Alloscardovia criceti]